ncbi:hypothetical protein NDU88_004818 [Pleurodeles waltl]|uniref:Uncharacterized protein n=1 Tax=Pleurodeles waltl TaxID=8319 RepID=A0AAV7WXR7_PLEWA|nr:hypothetical protein NDU88_004818 [Pleurodeles waltl]
MIPHLGEDLILSNDYENFTPLLEKACQENIANAWWAEAPFGTTEIDVRPVRKKLSWKEKREQRQEYQDRLPPEIPESVPQTGTVLTIAGTFRQAQREDHTLKNTWQQALHPDGRSVGPTSPLKITYCTDVHLTQQKESLNWWFPKRTNNRSYI